MVIRYHCESNNIVTTDPYSYLKEGHIFIQIKIQLETSYTHSESNIFSYKGTF